MPQTLQCYKCGAQNILGMRFCTNCGERFLYKCPQCGTNIEPGFGYCSGCSARLDWGTGTEQTVATNSGPIKLTETEQEEKKEKEQSKQRGLSLWLIAFIIVVLLIAAIFAIDAIF
jgi:uncharacterized membrane protein YvbJ